MTLVNGIGHDGALLFRRYLHPTRPPLRSNSDRAIQLSAGMEALCCQYRDRESHSGPCRFARKRSACRALSRAARGGRCGGDRCSRARLRSDGDSPRDQRKAPRDVSRRIARTDPDRGSIPGSGCERRERQGGPGMQWAREGEAVPCGSPAQSPYRRGTNDALMHIECCPIAAKMHPVVSPSVVSEHAWLHHTSPRALHPEERYDLHDATSRAPRGWSRHLRSGDGASAPLGSRGEGTVMARRHPARETRGSADLRAPTRTPHSEVTV